MLEVRTGLEVDDITRLLKVCLDATYHTFQDTHYQQTFGTAMGSPVLVTVANLVMEEIESKALSTLLQPHVFGNAMWTIRAQRSPLDCSMIT